MPNPVSDGLLEAGHQNRREFLQSAATAGLALVVAGAPALAATMAKPDYTLRIAPVSFEIAPRQDYSNRRL
jgi:hypothetical protein